MGMAASQARYLSLSARKTNTEYEGQQLNQQRLNIANQSADLFNQMLGMEVPVCPDSNNYTTLQYSWSDGINDEVISDFYQIAVPNEDYNYVVTSYRYDNIYTGQSKRMSSPEIQHSKTNQFTDKPDKEYHVTQSTYHRESLPGAGDDSYTLVVNRNGVESTHVFKRLDKTIDSIEEVDAFTKRTKKATAGDKAYYLSADGSRGTNASWAFDSDIDFVDVKISKAGFTGEMHETGDSSGATTDNLPYDEKSFTIDAYEKFLKIDFDDENDRDKIEQLLSIYGDKYDSSKTYYAYALGSNTTDAGHYDDGLGNVSDINLVRYNGSDGNAYYEYNGKYYKQSDVTGGTITEGTTPEADLTGVTLQLDVDMSGAITDAAGNQLYAFICGEDMNQASGSQGDVSQVEVRTGDKTTYYSDGTYILTAGELSAIDLTDPDQSLWWDTIFFHREENSPVYSNYTAVGNCALNAVSIDGYNSNEDMQIEIQQVIDDMKAGGNNVAYGNLSSCFDSSTGEYIGGIYSFKMYGHTYYTTTADLETAVAGAYKENATATNGIDSQDKLCYYTSTYISQKIEETKKALMETDGKGRFTSVKFEDDDTVYTLKVETITDQDAYDNAMNQYFYKQEKYDKAIADLNARNEIIQAQDRQLQLRLEQLGTEQTALQTEMEAVQKVVSKSIESTFKTFGG